MGSQPIKTLSKRRIIGSKDGLDRGLNDPNLSGAYIRSLVRQLSSSKNLANPADLKTEVHKSSTESAMNVAGSGTYGSSTNLVKIQDSDGTHNPEVSSCISSVCAPDHQQQQKKQIRRRPHTRKKSQDCPLNIAQARKEIVTALHLHRAAASKLQAARSQTESQKPRNNTNVSSSHNTHDSAGMRCNSCLPIKGAEALYEEAKAITICGHLLCWTCLSEYFLHLSACVVKICPVCANPLTTKHIFPIAAGVPILIEQSAAFTTSILHQSSPLLINPLPLPQPQSAWSTTGPSSGISMDEIISSRIDISQYLNINYISVSPNLLQQSLTAMDNATTEAFSVASEIPESCIGAVNPEKGHSIRGNCRHVAMDEMELAEIRSLAEQHEMEWSDSVNLATSTWWFNFLKTSEFNSDMDILYQAGFDSSHYSSLENVVKHEEMGFYPVQLEDPLSNINESFYISSELTVESLWPEEWFDYEQEDCKEVHEIEFNENHLVATSSSEVFKHNKSAWDEDI